MTVTASAPADLHPTRTAPAGRTEIRTAAEFGRLMARFHQTRDRRYLDVLTAAENDAAELMLAALTDITYDGANGLAPTFTQPQWIGNVWNDKRYQRKIIPLLGGSKPLTSLELEGWKWGQKPVVAPWAGNKSPIPSGPVTVEPNPGTATRYAGGHDIARELRDFGSPEFWTAYINAMTDSYAEVTDEATGDALVAGATAVTGDTVPDGAPLGLVLVVDGALSMLDIATPSWALVAPDLWRDLVLTPTDHAFEFLSASIGLENGSASSFQLLPWSGLPAGSVLVGDSAAADSYELPGSPIRVEAEAIASGGLDEGFFGYHGVVINEPEALALVTAAVTPLTTGDTAAESGTKRGK